MKCTAIMIQCPYIRYTKNNPPWYRYFKCSRVLARFWSCLFFLVCGVKSDFEMVKLNYSDIFPNKIKARSKLAWFFQHPSWHCKLVCSFNLDKYLQQKKLVTGLWEDLRPGLRPSKIRQYYNSPSYFYQFVYFWIGFKGFGGFKYGSRLNF